MAKLQLHYRTVLGARTVVVEIKDVGTAIAILNAHQALGEDACLMEEIPRYSLEQHMDRHRSRVTKLRRVIGRWKARNAPKVIRIKTKLQLRSVR